MAGQQRVKRFVSRLLGRAPAEPPCGTCGEGTTVRQFSLTPRAGDAIEDWRVPEPRPDVLPAFVDGHVVLFDPLAELSHVLNPSASLIWSLVDGASDVRTIVDEVARHGSADRDVIDADVKGAIAGLVESGVIVAGLPDDAASAERHPPGGAAADRGDPRAEPADAADLAWTFGPYQAAGTDVLVATNDGDVAAAVREAFAALEPSSAGEAEVSPITILAVDAGPEVSRGLQVFVDGRCTWSSSDREIFPAQVVAEVNEAVVERSVGSVRFHAAAVERDGRVVLLAGASGSGKSTLAAALVRRGWRYLTDEVAAVSPGDLAVVPYAKALDLGPRSLEMLGLERRGATPRPSGAAKSRVPVRQLGEVSAGGTVGLVVLIDGAEPPDDRGVDTPRAARDLVSLIATCFAASFDGQVAMDTLVEIVERVPVVRLTRGPLDEACARVEASFVIGGT